MSTTVFHGVATGLAMCIIHIKFTRLILCASLGFTGLIKDTCFAERVPLAVLHLNIVISLLLRLPSELKVVFSSFH